MYIDNVMLNGYFFEYPTSDVVFHGYRTARVEIPFARVELNHLDAKTRAELEERLSRLHEKANGRETNHVLYEIIPNSSAKMPYSIEVSDGVITFGAGVILKNW